jgi:CRISPR/Cas system endoribonuclease Cas6 (RAMP superfamily)
LEEKVKERKEINIGEMQLELNNVKRLKIRLNKNFEIFKFRKEIAIPLVINGREQIVIDSTWSFYFTYLTKEQRKILEFGIDCGFGREIAWGLGLLT